MVAELLARLGISAGLVALGLGLYWAWNRWQLRRLTRAAGQPLLGLADFKIGVPGILYFTTPDCVVCRTTQRPALHRLQAELGDGLQIVEVDATARPDLADYWGVLSVPTTFVIDAAGHPSSLNHGLTSKDKLLRQIEATRHGTSASPVGPVAEAPLAHLKN
jgi:thiol-disulfide isomerase/thioredoxin